MLRKLSAFAFVLALGAPAFAQNPDYTLRALDNSDGDATIGVAAGDVDVRVDVVLDFPNGMAVDAWSFGLCHDGGIVNLPGATAPSPNMNDALNLQEFGPAGIMGAPVLSNGTSFPAFATDAVFDDGAGGDQDGFTSAVVVDFLLMNTLPAQANALVNVAFYDVLVDPGAGSPLEFCGVLGAVPVSIDVIVSQLALVPTVADAMFVGAVPAGFTYSVSVPDVDPMTTDIEVNELQSFVATVSFEDGAATPADLQGFSLGIANQANVTAVSADPASAVAALNGGTGPSFFGPNILADGVTVGVAFDTASVATLSYGTIDAVVDITYDAADVAADEASSLDFVDTLGSPVVQNEYVVGGFSVAPTDLVNASFTILDNPAVVGNFFRGECNQSGDYDLADGIFLLNSINNVGGDPACPDSCDFNADGMLTVMDAVDSFAYLFIGGAAPLAPFPACDDAPLLVDPTCMFDAALCP